MPRSSIVFVLLIIILAGNSIDLQGVCAMKVIAHRGDSSHFPENTLAAFESALKKGSDLVELDSHDTKDGVLVVLHDSKLDRTTNSESVFGKTDVLVSKVTLDQIRLLDAGSWKSDQFKGEPLPTLEASLKVIQASSTTLLERKAGTALSHAKLIKKLGYTDKLVVQSFDWDFLAALKVWLPGVQMAALGGEDVTRSQLEDLKLLDITTVAWNHEKLTSEAVAMIHENGFKLWAWTVDEPAEWQRLVDLKLDGIITNRPGELSAWLKEHGIR